jgi:hypothetical protein
MPGTKKTENHYTQTEKSQQVVAHEVFAEQQPVAFLALCNE